MLRFASKFLAALAAACLVPFAFAQPANDMCTSASVVSEGSFPFTTVGATPDGPNATCRVGGAASRNNVWFRYIAGGTGTVTISTCGANDTTLSVFTGSCGSLTQVACDDDSCSSPTSLSSTLTLPVTAGNAYVIQVAQWGSSAVAGNLVIAAPAGAVPVNDLCTAATTVGEGSFSFSTAWSTANGPAAVCRVGGPQVTKDVFFRYIPSGTGSVRISTCGAGDTTLSVLAGACGSLTPVACDDDSCVAPPDLSSTLTFNAVAGSPVIIRVAEWWVPAGAPLSGTLVIQPIAPANDTCATAPAVNEGAFPFTTFAADASGPAATCRVFGPEITKDVFFRYTATGTGPVTISTCGAGDTTVSVLTGDCGALTQVACDDDSCPAPPDLSSFVTFPAVAGTSYTIRVANWSISAFTNLAGTLVIQGPTPPNDTCASAPLVGEGVHPFTTNFATADGPAALCRFDGPAVTKDVFFRFVPPADAIVRFGTCGAGDTTVTVLPSCGSPAVGCDDDACAFPTVFSSDLFVPLTGGTVYVVRVANWAISPFAFLSGNLVIDVLCDDLDFNNDEVFPDDQDLADFLSVLAGGFCPTCNDVDFNNDGVFPDDEDLQAFLRVLAGGAC